MNLIYAFYIAVDKQGVASPVDLTFDKWNADLIIYQESDHLHQKDQP